MPVIINTTAAAQPGSFDCEGLPRDREGKLFLDVDGDLFIGTDAGNGLMRVFTDGRLDTDYPTVRWPVRYAPASYSVTFQN